MKRKSYPRERKLEEKTRYPDHGRRALPIIEYPFDDFLPDVAKVWYDGVRLSFFFPHNGYGAFVERHCFSWGYEEGLWEISITSNGAILYVSPLGAGIIGWANEAEVAQVLQRIHGLKKN